MLEDINRKKDDFVNWFCWRCLNDVYVKKPSDLLECPECGYPRRAGEDTEWCCPHGVDWSRCSPSRFRACSKMGSRDGDDYSRKPCGAPSEYEMANKDYW
jgi:hypothetical protein